MNQLSSLWPPFQLQMEDWKYSEVKYLYDILLGKMLQPEPRRADDREVPYLRAANVQWDGVRLDDFQTMYASDEEIKTSHVKEGDLLVCEGGEVGRAAILKGKIPPDTIIQNALHRVRGKHGNHVGFLRYLLQHIASKGWFDVICNRATIAHFTGEKFGELRIAYPEPAMQAAIADYLDRETAKLDNTISAKQSLFNLLVEKRRALIAQAVTKGLDSSVQMKDSGIPWLGEIPAHWKIDRARFLFVQSNLPVQSDNKMVTCFRDGTVTLRSNRREDGFTNGILELGYQGIRCGQLVIHSMDGFAGSIGVSDSDGKCSPEYVICDPLTDKTDAHYYAMLLREMALRSFIQASCPAVRERAPRIRFNDFKDFYLPIPPLHEQQEIVACLGKLVTPIEQLFVSTKNTIKLLQERRAALISDAVTGKIPLESMNLQSGGGDED